MSGLAKGRIAGCLIAAASLVASVYLTNQAIKRHAEFRSWISARPFETTIDLSGPGEWTVPFQQTCSVSHGEGIFLASPPSFSRDTVVEEILGDLTGSVFVFDENGDEIAHTIIDGSDATSWRDSGDIRLSGLYPFSKGEYVARITIDTGSPALSDTNQTIYAAYDLCGLEMLPAQISAFGAFGFGITALIAAACVIPGFIRYGLRSPTVIEQREESEFE